MKSRLPGGKPAQRRMIMGAAAMAALAWLAGCQQNKEKQIDLPAPIQQQVRTGDTFSLTSPLAIPAGTRKALFQNEQIIAPSALSPAFPYCTLVPEGNSPLIIEPGTLTVRGVFYSERELGATDRMVSVTRIALSPFPFANVYTLRCGWPEGSTQASFVSADQIFNAVGGTFTLGRPQ
jgi:hypothetical protein